MISEIARTILVIVIDQRFHCDSYLLKSSKWRQRSKDNIYVSPSFHTRLSHPFSWSLSLYLNCHPKSLKYQGLNSFLLYTEYKWKRVKCEVNLKQGKVCDLNFWIASLFSAKVLCLSCFPREGPCLTDCNLEYILGGNITKIMASIYETW